MIRATLYIMACTTKNRVRRRIARLREPRYLLGALVGSAYLYFAVFGRFRMNRRIAARTDARSAATLFPGLTAAVPIYCGIGLMLMAAVSWLMPVRSRLLEFSQAETEMLFPAPVTRRQLLVYRLLRSQVAVFFGSLVFAVVFPRGSVAARVRGLFAVWLIMMTSQMFFTGIALWRARSRGRGEAPWLTAIPMVFSAGGALTLGAGVVVAVVRAPVQTAAEAFAVINRVATTGLTEWLLLPSVALVRPLFTDGWTQFLITLVPALVVYLAVVGWALVSDGAIDALAQDATERQAQRPAGRRPTAYRARPIAWALSPVGRAEPAFLWKAMIQTFRVVDRRVFLRVFAFIVWSTVVVSLMSRARGIAQVIGFFAAFASAFTVMLGPQIVRTDLRQDLQHLETMKTWPIRAAAVVRGEMAWPAGFVTLIAWVLGAVAITLSQTAFSRVGWSVRLPIGIAAMVLAPGLIFAQYTVHNAAALLFPAWIASGQGRPRGVDAMGQRLIMFSGVLIVLVLAVLPAVLVGGVLWFAFARFVGTWILIPAALIGLAIIALEVLLATEALGPAYERLDITSVERAE